MTRQFITVPALLAGIALTLGACGGGGGGGGSAVDNTTAKTGIIPAITKDMWDHLKCESQRSFGSSPNVEKMIPVHINNDNHIDFIAQLHCEDLPYGRLHNEAVDETVVAYLSNDKGEYRVATEEVFGSSVVRVNGLGKYRVTDINRDGKKDIIWNLNKEDGRSSMGDEGLYNNGGNPVVLMSTPNGFEVQTLPIYGWFHGVTYADYPTHTDVWFASFTTEHYQMRYQNGMWAQVNKFENLSTDYRDGIIDSKWATGMQHVKTKSGKEVIISQTSYWDYNVGGYLAQGLGSTTTDGELISYDMIDAEITVAVCGWTEGYKCVGQTATTAVMNFDGDQWAYANHDKVCHMKNLVPGGPEYIVGQMWGFRNVSGTPWVQGQEVYEKGPGSRSGMRFNFFEIKDDGSIAQVPAPFVYQDMDINPMGSWMRCDDMNGDGYADLAVGTLSNLPEFEDNGRGGAPTLYLNDGTGKLVLVPLSDLPQATIGAWHHGQYATNLIVDADSDGDEDIIIYGTTQPYDGVIHYTK